MHCCRWRICFWNGVALRIIYVGTGAYFIHRNRIAINGSLVSNNSNQARNMWSQLSQEQKTNYGEEYFERALRSLEKYTEKVNCCVITP